MSIRSILNDIKTELRARFEFCTEPYWAHKWDYGSIIDCSNANAIERYTCKRCGAHHYVILGR